MKGKTNNSLNTFSINEKLNIFSSVEDRLKPLSSPPRAPAPEDCQEVDIIFDKHFDAKKWMQYQRADHFYKQQQKGVEDDYLSDFYQFYQ